MIGQSFWDDLFTDLPSWISNGPPKEDPSYGDFAADMKEELKKGIWVYGTNNV